MQIDVFLHCWGCYHIVYPFWLTIHSEHDNFRVCGIAGSDGILCSQTAVFLFTKYSAQVDWSFEWLSCEGAESWSTGSKTHWLCHSESRNSRWVHNTYSVCNKEKWKQNIRCSMICTLSHILLGWSHQENEVDRSCGMHGREKKCVRILVGKTWRTYTTWKS